MGKSAKGCEIQESGTVVNLVTSMAIPNEKTFTSVQVISSLTFDIFITTILITSFFIKSQRVMRLRHNVVCSFNIRYQQVSVLHVNTELPLQSLVYVYTCLNINIPSFVSPVSIEGYGHSLALLSFLHSNAMDLSRSTSYGQP